MPAVQSKIEIVCGWPKLKSAKTGNLRKDIQGLRAWAVLLVVIFHAKLIPISGGFVGVDVFFVLSGFLITSGLIREIDETGRINLIAFWARRARRLLPASSLVLATTLILGLVFLPLLEQKALIRDVFWATIFLANLNFAQTQTDYWATQTAVSPVLHFWSLSVEEQFYFVWPFLLLLCFSVSKLSAAPKQPSDLLKNSLLKLMGSRYRTNFPIAILCMVVVCWSFIQNLNTTELNQPFAYFGTSSRAWQLAVGGLLAATSPATQLIPSSIKCWSFSTGFSLIFLSAIFLNEGSTLGFIYPGLLATLPTLGAALVIIGGESKKQRGIYRMTNHQIAQSIGSISYSLYLVHWPLLVLGNLIIGKSDFGINLALATISIPLAWGITNFVENPIRFSRRMNTNNIRCLKSAGMAITVLLCLGFLANVQVQSVAASTAAVMSDEQKLIQLRPNPALASSDFVSLTSQGCSLGFFDIEPSSCLFGSRSGEKSIVLLGDSHASAVFPVINRTAIRNKWRLYVWEKNSCPFSDATKFDKARRRLFRECDQFRSRIIERIIQLHPDLVIISQAYNPNTVVLNRPLGALSSPAQSQKILAQGLVTSATQLTAKKIPVLYLHEPPYAPLNPPECLIAKRKVSACTFSAPQISPEFLATKDLDRIKVLDLYSKVCSEKLCNPVQGNLLVYRDRTHMTKTYVLSLYDQFEKSLTSVLAD